MSDIWNYLDAVRRPDQDVNKLFRFLGIEIKQLDPDCTVLFMPFQEGFLQGGRVTAGGILATLLDETMAHAALASLGPGESTVTVDLNVQYLSPAHPGRDLTATARIVRRGGTVIHLEGEVTTENKAHSQVTAAKGTAAFLVLKDRN